MKKILTLIRANITFLLMRMAMHCNLEIFTSLAVIATAQFMHSKGAVRMEVDGVDEDGSGVKVRFIVPVDEDQPQPKDAAEWVEEWKNQATGNPTIH